MLVPVRAHLSCFLCVTQDTEWPTTQRRMFLSLSLRPKRLVRGLDSGCLPFTTLLSGTAVIFQYGANWVKDQPLRSTCRGSTCRCPMKRFDLQRLKLRLPCPRRSFSWKMTGLSEKPFASYFSPVATSLLRRRLYMTQ